MKSYIPGFLKVFRNKLFIGLLLTTTVCYQCGSVQEKVVEAGNLISMDRWSAFFVGVTTH